MHIPHGFWKDGLGDIDVITHGDTLHAFYLCIPSHDRVGHLTSTDGLTWHEQPAAIHTGAPGDFDDDQIWTMGVFAHRGRFFMLYTGLSTQERGKIQRVGVAVSDDLFTWRKHDKNPVICADPRWYESTVDANHRVDWRDPWAVVDGDTIHGVICARSNQGPENRRGCAGYFTSNNGLDWQIQPPLCVPGAVYDFETPAIARLNHRYYLTAIFGKNRDTTSPSAYRVADQITGPYRRVEHDELLHGDNLVFKPVHWRGKTYYFHNLRGIADWPTGGRCTITSLAPPKRADTNEAGALILRPFDAWHAAHAGRAQKWDAPALHAAGKPVTGNWSLNNGALRGESPTGYGSFLLNDEQENVQIHAEFSEINAHEFGLLLRSDEHADNATLLILTPALRRVQLVTMDPFYKTPCAGVTYRWRGRRIVQEWTSPQPWGSRMTLQLTAFGPYCEVSIDDRVLISAITMTRPRGRIGLFVEDGSVSVKEFSVTPLRMPACASACV